MNLSLVVLNAGKAAGQVVPVPVPEFVVGRDAQCNLRPASVLISKKHCSIVTRGEEVFVRDFGSTNGTFVNDKLVKGEVRVVHNDTVKIGPLHFRISMADAGTATVHDVAPKVSTKETFVAKETVAPTRSGHDDDAADMLLEMDSSDGNESSSVPDGSTICDAIPSMMMDTKPEKTGHTPAGGIPISRPAALKKPVDDAQSAAAAIFAKFKLKK